MDWRDLVALHIPNIEKPRGFFFAEKNIFRKFQNFLRRKGDIFLTLLDVFWNFLYDFFGFV